MDSHQVIVSLPKSPPRFLKFRSSRLVILVTVCAAAFTDGFIYSVLVPVLPLTLRDVYHVAPSDVQAWTSGLLGIFGASVLLGSPMVGWVSDSSSSRKPAYTFGLLCLVGGVVTLGISTKLWVLVVARILQGISAAVVFTIGLALIADTVNPKSIGYCMGYALSAMSCGVLAGPVIGSLIFNAAGYIAVVGTMLGITFVDIVLRLIMIEKSSARAWEQVPGEPTERTKLLPGGHGIKVGSFQAFRLLANPHIATALYGVFVHVVIIACFDGVLPIFVERIFGWRSLDVVLCFLAIGIPNTFLGPLFGSVCDTYGPRWPAFCGCVLTAIPMILLQLVKQNTTEQVWLIYILLASCGTALPLIISPLAADLFYVVEKLDENGDGTAYAQSYGLFTCAMAGGTLVGLVLAGFLKERFGWTVMAWVLGVLVASGAIPVYFYTGRSDTS